MPLNILILCTGNSARSILGEGLVGHVSQGRARGFSAGSHPAGGVNPVALETLARHGVPIENPRSKSWDEFSAPGAPVMDLVITVCDSAARETCPVWPGAPVQAHWGVPDPAFVQPIEARREAFEIVFETLRRRFEAFFANPVETLSGPERRALLQQIAESIE
jgi:arsenate reductase (thioredoxin)